MKEIRATVQEVPLMLETEEYASLEKQRNSIQYQGALYFQACMDGIHASLKIKKKTWNNCLSEA